jgi:predicted transcriptional regulator
MNSVITEATVKRRDKLVIMAEIMDISKTRALKTQIMYKANLSFSQLNEYIKLLTKIKLLEKTVDENGKEIYRSTSKGKDFLLRHQEIMELLFEDQSPKCSTRIPSENIFRKIHNKPIGA